jgi:membrane associated rhomboid family serine protease
VAVRRYNPGYTPPATLALVGINVAVAVIDLLTGGFLERLLWGRGIDIQYGEYWRLFTCGWVHANLIHIALNAYGIYVLGVIFERLQGWKPLLIVYLASLFGGSGLAMAFMDPNVPLVGASGAAYGLFGAVLAFFYARTGSLRELWAIPMARTLVIWLGVGVWMSLQPGISLLGHLGGFVPGVVLGVFFEHRYARQLDIYHKIAAAVVVLVVAGLCAFASFPMTRASWYGAQALRAYEDGDFERGDDLLARARGKRHGSDGATRLLTHVRVWRRFHEMLPDQFTIEVLRYPLTHPRLIEEPGMPDMPFHFLIDPDSVEPEPLESGDGAP